MGVRAGQVAAVVVVVLLGTACGDGDGVVRTPAVEAPQAEVVTFKAGGKELSGFAFGNTETAVVLAHGEDGAKEDWIDVAVDLSKNGVASFPFDFRGYGGQAGKKDTKLVRDLRAAVEAMRSRGASTIYVVGASMGGTAALATGAKEDLAGVISVSAPAKFAGINARSAAKRVDEPVLIVVAEDDEPFVADAQELAGAAAAQLVTYSGSSHGTDLLVDHRDELTALILGFVKDPTAPIESATRPPAAAEESAPSQAPASQAPGSEEQPPEAVPPPS